MHAILNFSDYILQAILTLLLWTVILYAIASTLISFEIINLRNRFAYGVWRTLEAVALPILRPIRRILPRTGQVDFSPFVVVILTIGVQNYLLPPLFAWLHSLVGPVAY